MKAREFGSLPSDQVKELLIEHFSLPWFNSEWLADIALSAYGFRDTYDLSGGDIFRDFYFSFDEIESISAGLHLISLTARANSRAEHVSIKQIDDMPFSSWVEIVGEDVIRRSYDLGAESLRLMLKEQIGFQCPVIWFTEPALEDAVTGFLLLAYDWQDCIWAIINGAPDPNRTMDVASYVRPL